MGKSALIVGVDIYPDPEDHLEGCVADSEAVATILSMPEYGFDVRRLINSAATREGIFQGLAEMGREGGEFFLFYFAGHGQVAHSSGYICPSDVSSWNYGISLTELAQVVSDISSRFDHVALILDSCHSGAATTWVDRRPLTPSVVVEQMPLLDSSRSVLAACRPEEGALENPDTKRGVFTEVLEDALMGGAVDYDGNVSIFNIADFISKSPRLTDQTFVFKGDSSGEVCLGSGFTPRPGKPLESEVRRGILAKASGLLEVYNNLQLRELSNPEQRSQRGLRTCALELADACRWLEQSEIDYPDLRADAEWKQMRRLALNYLEGVARVDVGACLPVGVVSDYIGDGGYGRVWRVKNAVEDLAYKIFHGGNLGDAVRLQRFRNGFHSMRKLDHPRIVKVRELTEAPVGFTMQYIDGPDLSNHYIDRMDGLGLLELCASIADTIAYAHSRGVVHRDIKPANIVMQVDVDSGAWTPHVTDFDLAYLATNKTVTVQALGGAVNYAAPEQFFQPGSRVERLATVDVYAFAQLLFYVFVGTDPRAEQVSANISALEQAVSNTLVEGAYTLVRHIYVESTRRDPGMRIQSMDEVRRMLLSAKSRQSEGTFSSSQSGVEMARRIAYVYRGGSDYEALQDGVRFDSRAGMLRVTVVEVSAGGSQKVDFEITFEPLMQLPMSGVASSETARGRFERRIDRRLSDISGAQRSSRDGSRAFKVRSEGIVMNQIGHDRLIEIVSSVIEVLEGG
ncbi:protein kinase domain-containing protein [Micrococcus luteus]|uniref:protein kinase domain-containing protein n=1 Tax=Micrococcus luteus TaxID=1270 RepID=UPI001CDAD7EC|nr:protein kinase [Micrococcus luteus]